LSAGLAAVLAVTAGAALATEFKYSSWTGPLAPNNKFGTLPMFEQIEKATKGTPNELTFANFMGAQLYNAFTTLAGVRDGAVDGGVTVPVFNAAELKTHVLFPDMQALTDDGYVGAAAGTETLLMHCPECVAEYGAQNSISLGVYGGSPYYLMCNFDVTSMDDLKGRKSAEGNPMFARWSEALGMTRIQLPPNEYAQALQRGTADCVFGPKDWMNGMSLKDGVKTVVDNQHNGVFAAVSIMTVNKDSWANKLSAGQRQVILDHMPSTIMRTVTGYYDEEARGEADAKAKGIKFISLGEDYAKAWEAFKAKELDNVVAAAEGRGVANARQIAEAYLAAMKKWEGIFESVGRDPDKLADEMVKQIYANAKL
jgi:TRAP-type C4-dicarboxylate transport system substrate-binding protein